MVLAPLVSSLKSAKSWWVCLIWKFNRFTSRALKSNVGLITILLKVLSLFLSFSMLWNEWVAYFCFLSLKLLTREEEQHKDEMISAAEQVLASNGIECDQEWAKMSEEQTVKILEQVRKLRAKKKKRVLDEEDGSIGELEEDEQHDEKEVVYAGTG